MSKITKCCYYVTIFVIYNLINLFALGYAEY